MDIERINVYNESLKWMGIKNALRLLHEGERLSVGNYKLVMGTDFSIGYLMTNVDTGEEHCMGDITFREFCRLINEEADRNGIILGRRGEIY